VLPLPFLLFGLPAHAADTFDSGSLGQGLTEIETRNALTKKVEEAAAAGKGIDVNRRGQFNEKALFAGK